MFRINYLAVVAAAFTAFVSSFVWYIIFGSELAKVSAAFAEQKPSVWKMLGVLGLSSVLAFAVAYVIGLKEDTDWISAVKIGFLLWLGLSAVQWASSIMFEDVPLRMAAIHAGDWLLEDTDYIRDSRLMAQIKR